MQGRRIENDKVTYGRSFKLDGAPIIKDNPFTRYPGASASLYRHLPHCRYYLSSFRVRAAGQLFVPELRDIEHLAHIDQIISPFGGTKQRTPRTQKFNGGGYTHGGFVSAVARQHPALRPHGDRSFSGPGFARSDQRRVCVHRRQRLEVAARAARHRNVRPNGDNGCSTHCPRSCSSAVMPSTMARR